MIGHRLRLVGGVATLMAVVSGCGGVGSASPTAVPAASIRSTPSRSAEPPSPMPDTSPQVSPSAQTSPPKTADASVPLTTPPAAAWSELAVGAGPSAREDHTWTVADGGAAYLFGGRADDGPSDELWQYDLETTSWARVQPGNAGPQARFGHTATWVSDVGLVVWSGQGGSGFFDDIWSFDPSSNSWSQLNSTGAVPEARYGSCASVGPDGQLWISHGFTADSGRFADTRSYDFATGTWTDRTPSGDVPVKRCLHDCFWSSDGQLILYGGQTTGVAAIGDLWSFDPASGAWRQAAEPEAAPRQLYAIATTGESAIVFGGGSVDRGYLNDTWLLDPALPALSELDVPSAPSARSGAALIVDPASDDVILFGGQGADGLFADTWILENPL